MAFVDEVQIHISAGKGGDGVVRWHREKFKPEGGPAGGNGGKGGDVYALAVSDLSYLENYRHEKNFTAEHGDPGGNNSCEGKNGEDLVLKFPVGSVIKNLTTEQNIHLETIGQRELLLLGGRGGLGNEHFKSSTNRSPEESTPGKIGDQSHFYIELQLFADIGLVGLPSAGKSTLLNALTNAKSKVAEYHFTTLEPHLGVLAGGAILADIPGLIEGASEGKGLGIQFLRHIKRTKVLAHVVPADSEDIVSAYATIRTELKNYGEGLFEKEEIIILSKSDTVSPEELEEKKKLLEKHTSKSVITISAYDSEALKDLQDVLHRAVRV